MMRVMSGSGIAARSVVRVDDVRSDGRSCRRIVSGVACGLAPIFVLGSIGAGRGHHEPIVRQRPPWRRGDSHTTEGGRAARQCGASSRPCRRRPGRERARDAAPRERDFAQSEA